MSQQKKWDVKNSSALYGLDFWGKPYFSINSKGHAQVSPHPEISSESLDIFQIVKDLKETQMRLPLLLRFPDVIESQMKKICGCFEKAIQDQDYKGQYYGVFPIKVNQQRHIIEDVVKAGYKYNYGLEAGSKPELLIALAHMDNPDAFIICNGFKDKSYVEMALIAQKAGKNIFLVVERKKELNIILELSREIGVRPQIGFRLKLNTQYDGLWSKSSGSFSKFGLTAAELLSAVQDLKKQKFLDCVKLIHFHIGSQIPSIQPIKSSVKETARIFAELIALNCPIEYIDVGGGLGVDYDGSGAARSSTDYDVQEYANDVVFGIQSVCDESQIAHPHIISESGRFLLAQSSLLVFNVLDSNSRDKNKKINIRKNSHSFVQEMHDIYKNMHQLSYNETFNDLIEKKKVMHQLFIYGMLNLQDISEAETIYLACIDELKTLTANKEEHEDIFETLKQKYTDTYFCNFSVFQSLPDSWALSYIFPILPIHRLKEEPQRRAQLVDLTCDSDGCISKMIDYNTWKIEADMPVHTLKPNQDYWIGVFLTGAYQEILGDLHNLFGDTDVAHIKIKGNNQYSVEHRVDGDTISEVLDYVEYNRKDLVGKINKLTDQSVSEGKLSRQEAGFLLEKFENNLSYYTYLK